MAKLIGHLVINCFKLQDYLAYYFYAPMDTLHFIFVKSPDLQFYVKSFQLF